VEYECWECWNRYRIVLDGEPPLNAVTFEAPCPYCGRPNEFSAPVLRIELAPISEPRRRLGNLQRRLVLSGADIRTRIHERRDEIAAWIKRLHHPSQIAQP